jgi:hypothetical protein
MRTRASGRRETSRDDPEERDASAEHQLRYEYPATKLGSDELNPMLEKMMPDDDWNGWLALERAYEESMH